MDTTHPALVVGHANAAQLLIDAGHPAVHAPSTTVAWHRLDTSAPPFSALIMSNTTQSGTESRSLRSLAAMAASHDIPVIVILELPTLHPGFLHEHDMPVTAVITWPQLAAAVGLAVDTTSPGGLAADLPHGRTWAGGENLTGYKRAVLCINAEGLPEVAGAFAGGLGPLDNLADCPNPAHGSLNTPDLSGCEDGFSAWADHKDAVAYDLNGDALVATVELSGLIMTFAKPSSARVELNAARQRVVNLAIANVCHACDVPAAAVSLDQIDEYGDRLARPVCTSHATGDVLTQADIDQMVADELDRLDKAATHQT